MAEQIQEIPEEKNEEKKEIIENSGNYDTDSPEFRQDFPNLERTQDAKTKSESILMSKGQFSENSSTIKRIVHAEKEKSGFGFKLFDIYDVTEIKIKDPALKPYINFEPRLLLKSQGRNLGKFGKAKVNILERLANRIAVPGHAGKKHKIITSWGSGKYSKNMKTVINALTIIEKRTKRNPLQVFVDAIENGSPRDEITVIEHAGARYPQAVDTSPMRRVDLALRWVVQGAYQRCFGKKKKMAESLADEVIKAADKNMESYSMGKKNEAEKQADSAR